MSQAESTRHDGPPCEAGGRSRPDPGCAPATPSDLADHLSNLDALDGHTRGWTFAGLRVWHRHRCYFPALADDDVQALSVDWLQPISRHHTWDLPNSGKDFGFQNLAGGLILVRVNGRMGDSRVYGAPPHRKKSCQASFCVP